MSKPTAGWEMTADGGEGRAEDMGARLGTKKPTRGEDPSHDVRSGLSSFLGGKSQGTRLSSELGKAPVLMGFS